MKRANKSTKAKPAPKKNGRPLKPLGEGNRVWRSKKAAAICLGVSINTLDEMRDNGCPAFRHGRIYEVELMPELAKRKAEGESFVQGELFLKDQKTAEEVRRLKIANDLSEGKLVDPHRIIQAIGRMGPRIGDLLDRKLRREYPAAVHGLDVASIAEYGQRLADLVMREFRSMADEWTAPQE